MVRKAASYLHARHHIVSIKVCVWRWGGVVGGGIAMPRDWYQLVRGRAGGCGAAALS